MEQVTKQPKRQRSCVVCGQKTGKTELLRIVRAADGTVSFDASGRAPGRGAYVCSQACFEEASAAKRLSRTLRTAMSPEDYERIAGELHAALRTATG